MKKKPLIMDCDPGNDDAVAIVLAALCGQFDLLGITVAHGNKPLAQTADNALRLVEFLGMDIPVYAGCPSAMVRTLMPGRKENVRSQRLHCVVNGEEITIHEAHFKLPETTRTVERQHACSFIVDTVRNSPEKVILAATAPMTNLGMALRMAPEIAENIEKIVLMGGGVNMGNRTPAAEANFYDDPEAAQIVLHAGCPVEVYPLDCTHTCMMDYADCESLRPYGKVGSYLADMIADYIRRTNLLRCSPEGFTPVHDSIALAGLIAPEIITESRNQPCDVDCSGGWADGKLVVDSRLSAATDSPVRVVYRVDHDRYMDLIRNTLQKAM